MSDVFNTPYKSFFQMLLDEHDVTRMQAHLSTLYANDGMHRDFIRWVGEGVHKPTRRPLAVVVPYPGDVLSPTPRETDAWLESLGAAMNGAVN